MKLLKHMLVGKRRPDVDHGDSNGEAKAAAILAREEYDDKCEQMFGVIVQHTDPNSGPWTICTGYANGVEAKDANYECHVLMVLLDNEYLGAPSRLEKL